MSNKPLKEEDLYYTDAPVGVILRHVREHYNQTLPDVENALRIRASQIDAIEKGDYEKLPGRVYAIGFIRAYAEYLGLDPDRIVNMFKNQAVDNSQKPILDFPVAAPDGKMPNIFVIGLCILLLIGAITATMYVQSTKPRPLDNIPSISDVALEENSLENKPQALDEIKPEIQFQTNQSSWVEIKDSQNKTLLSKVLEKGETIDIPDQEGLILSIGNAAAVEIIIGDINYGAMGGAGKVIRDLQLSRRILEEKYGQSGQNIVNPSTEN